jgi:hypothetical protein
VKYGVTHRSAMSPDMDTKNIGSITPQGNSPTSSHGRMGRGGFEEPDDFTMGPNGIVGMGASEYLNPEEGCGEDGF